jgi:hypothetical protein
MIEVGGTPGQGSLTSVAARTILNNLSIATALFDTVDLRLYTAGPTPNTAMKFADFTEAAFGGYTLAAGITMDTASWEGDDGIAQITGAATSIFDASGSAPVEDVLGWMITHGSGGGITVIYAELFDTPKHMEHVGDKITVLPVLKLNPAA